MRRETPSPSNGYNVCMNVYILSCYIYSVKYFYIFIFLYKIMGPCDILVRALFTTHHKRWWWATPSEGYVGRWTFFFCPTKWWLQEAILLFPPSLLHQRAFYLRNWTIGERWHYGRYGPSGFKYILSYCVYSVKCFCIFIDHE